MLGNVFYIKNIHSIGGVETMLYELVKKYSKDCSITVYYESGDRDQISRLRKYAEVIKYTPGTYIECKKFFANYNIKILSHVKAEEIIQVIHVDYKSVKVKPCVSPLVTKYLAVSQLAADSFKELTGITAEVCYNPLTIETPPRVLNLVSATRLTSEKGKSRMVKLGKALDRAGIPYTWTVFTNDTAEIRNPNIVYMQPRLDIREYLKNADYVVQLSSSESFCYTIVEALSLGVPIIATDLPVYKELGITDKYGFLLPLDMKDLPINEIYTKKFKFKFSPPKDDWEKLLDNTVIATYDPNELIEVKATNQYKLRKLKDAQLGIIPEPGHTWKVTRDRLDVLLGDNPYRVKLVEVVPHDS